VIRHLVRLVRQRTRWVNVLRALVYNYNPWIPRGYLSKVRLEQIRQLQMSPRLNELRDELLEWIQQGGGADWELAEGSDSPGRVPGEGVPPDDNSGDRPHDGIGYAPEPGPSQAISKSQAGGQLCGTGQCGVELGQSTPQPQIRENQQARGPSVAPAPDSECDLGLSTSSLTAALLQAVDLPQALAGGEDGCGSQVTGFAVMSCSGTKSTTRSLSDAVLAWVCLTRALVLR
jgi:hypothetical protein